MRKLSRRELKTDHFVEEVGHGVEYVAEHKKQFARYAIAGAVVLVAAIATFVFMQNRKTARQALLNKAYTIQTAPFGPPQQGTAPPYPTATARDAAANKAFAEVAAAYPSSEEGMTAKYFMGVIAANEAKWPDAEKLLKDVADNAKADTASLGKYALAQVYASQNKTSDAEKILRGLMDKPTVLVSKEQAQLTLARTLAKSNPAEAKKLLEPLRSSSSAVSRAAVSALSEVN